MLDFYGLRTTFIDFIHTHTHIHTYVWSYGCSKICFFLKSNQAMWSLFAKYCSNGQELKSGSILSSSLCSDPGKR